MPGVKVYEVIEDIDSEVEDPAEEKEHPLGKIDRIISDWNKKMVHFDK